MKAHRRKKKSGAFGIFKAVLYLLCNRPNEKEAAKKSAESDENWKKIVGSTHPLHVQDTPQSPVGSFRNSSLAALHISLLSEFFRSPGESSSSSTMNQCASSLNLPDLDNSDNEEDSDEVFDAITRDELIDAELKKFISQFYKQIQMQNTSCKEDPPAAMRYTECRLEVLTEAMLLADLEQDTVDFVPNFDNSQKEPALLPARIPNLLLNGVSGIAAGMATNISPHNLGFSYGEDRAPPAKAATGWLKIKAVMRWGIFIRKKAAEGEPVLWSWMRIRINQDTQMDLQEIVRLGDQEQLHKKDREFQKRRRGDRHMVQQ